MSVNKTKHSTYLQTGFPAEFCTLGIAEVIVWLEGGVEGGYKVEECFGTDRITQRTIAIVTHATTVLSVKIQTPGTGH